MANVDIGKYDGMPLTDALQEIDQVLRSSEDALEEGRALCKLCLRQDIDIYAKGSIRHKLWKIEKRLGYHSLFQSQSGQDRYIYKRFFKNKKNGIFVEVGGFDGWRGSNCFFFEKVLDWSGIIVEASPRLCDVTRYVRSAKVIHAAISDSDGTAQFVDVLSGLKQMGGLLDYYPPEALAQIRGKAGHEEQAIEVPSIKLDTLLRTHGFEHVDYCSIDVEGAETAILSAFNFRNFDISVFSVENNLKKQSPMIAEVMQSADYRLLDVVGNDEIWMKEGLA